MGVGSAFQMNDDRRVRQVISWNSGGRRREGPQKNWAETIRGDLRCLMRMSRGEAMRFSVDREEWRRYIA